VKDEVGNAATERTRVALLHITDTSRLLNAMKANPRALFPAAAKAQAAVAYLDSLQPDAVRMAA
jgi:antirestriction protein ArdC